jgi:hypothetical protein
VRKLYHNKDERCKRKQHIYNVSRGAKSDVERFSQIAPLKSLMLRAECSLLAPKPGLAHFRWFGYRRVMTTQQEIAPEANKAFSSCLLISLNTESEQDPRNLLTLRLNYQERRSAILPRTP